MIANGTKLANERIFIACGQAIIDGFKVDIDGNLWCGWGGSEETNGVAVFNPQGKQVGFIRTPERISNLVLGGDKKTACS